MTERERFEKAWNNRPWLLEEESDKDRAWRWWQLAIAPAPDIYNLPGHSETTAALSSLTIRKMT